MSACARASAHTCARACTQLCVLSAAPLDGSRPARPGPTRGHRARPAALPARGAQPSTARTPLAPSRPGPVPVPSPPRCPARTDPGSEPRDAPGDALKEEPRPLPGTALRSRPPGTPRPGRERWGALAPSVSPRAGAAGGLSAPIPPPRAPHSAAPRSQKRSRTPSPPSGCAPLPRGAERWRPPPCPTGTPAPPEPLPTARVWGSEAGRGVRLRSSVCSPPTHLRRGGRGAAPLPLCGGRVRSPAQRSTAAPDVEPRRQPEVVGAQSPRASPSSAPRQHGQPQRRAAGRGAAPEAGGAALRGGAARLGRAVGGSSPLRGASLCPSVPASERCRAVRGSESPLALSPGALRTANTAPSAPPSPSAVTDGPTTTTSPHERAGLTRGSPPAPSHGGRKKGLRWAAEPFCAPSLEGRPLGAGCGLVGAASAPGIANCRRPGAGGEEGPGTEPWVLWGCAGREMAPAAPTSSRGLCLREGASH